MRFSTPGSVALLAGSVYAAVGDWQQCRCPVLNSRIDTDSIQVAGSTGVEIHHAAQALAA